MCCLPFIEGLLITQLGDSVMAVKVLADGFEAGA